MQVATSRCGRFGHSEFVLEAEGATAEIYLAEWAKAIEDMVAKGSKFLPGQTFQMGWMLTMVMQHDRERLTLHEPDMQSMPIRWVPGITQTLQSAIVQNFTAESVGLTDRLDLPSAQNYLLICDRFSGGGFFMVRRTPQDGNDSGWFVGCLDPRHDHRLAAVHAMSVYEAFLKQRFIVGFLGLPPGCMMIADPSSGVRLTLNERPLEILPGSYLEGMLRGR